MNSLYCNPHKIHNGTYNTSCTLPFKKPLVSVNTLAMLLIYMTFKKSAYSTNPTVSACIHSHCEAKTKLRLGVRICTDLTQTCLQKFLLICFIWLRHIGLPGCHILPTCFLAPQIEMFLTAFSLFYTSERTKLQFTNSNSFVCIGLYHEARLVDYPANSGLSFGTLHYMTNLVQSRLTKEDQIKTCWQPKYWQVRSLEKLNQPSNRIKDKRVYNK